MLDFECRARCGCDQDEVPLRDLLDLTFVVFLDWSLRGLDLVRLRRFRLALEEDPTREGWGRGRGNVEAQAAWESVVPASPVVVPSPVEAGQ